MFARAEKLDSPTGAGLALRVQEATVPATGLLLISHGLAEHAGRYQRFAEFMSAKGFSVYAHDHRGHGSTTATDAHLGRFAQSDGVGKVIDDLRAVRERAASDHPGLPVFLLGHSMGGLIALNAAERDPHLYAGLAVWNSNFNPGIAGRAGQAILALERMFKGSDVPSAMLPRLTFETWGKSIPGHRTAFDWLSHDPAEVARYIDDPLCGFDASVSLWIDLFRLAFAGAAADRLRRLAKDLPIHLVGGGEDPATNGGREIRWLAARMRAAGLTRVTEIVYPAMRHETLNETGRESAMRDFADWCLARAEERK